MPSFIIDSENKTEDTKQSSPTKHNYKIVNALRMMFLTNVWGPIRIGRKRPIREDEIEELAENKTSQYLVRKAEKLWAKEVAKYGADASLMTLTAKMQRFDLMFFLLASLMQGLLFSVGRPLLLRKIIKLVQDDTTEDSTAYIFCIIFSAVVLFEGICQTSVSQFFRSRLGSSFVCWMSSLLHLKSTRISIEASSKMELNESSLVGSDVTRIYEDMRWLAILPYSIVSLFGASSVLIYTLGVSAAPGLVSMITIVIATFYLTKKVRLVEKENFEVIDKRLTILKEIVFGIKAIKMMAWEIPFITLITDVRDRESALLRKFRALSVTTINTGRSSPVFAIAASIFTLALTAKAGETLDPADVFAAVTAFQSLRLPLITIPNNIAQMQNVLLSFIRLKSYMLLDEAKPMLELPDNSEYSLTITDGNYRYSSATAESSKDKDVAINMNVNSVNDFRLSNISLKIQRHGGLVALIGEVGSGKTSLINSLLGSLHCISGEVRIAKAISYVPQKPFIISGSILENIILDMPLDEKLLALALQQSELDVDLAMLSHGQDTVVGERGQTLSGGQKQRLSIARALYRQPELLILDDPLAAVDPGVARSIFAKAVYGYVRNDDQRIEQRSVLMSLNQLYLLPHFDHIVVLKDGSIVEQGDWKTLSSDPKSHLSGMLIDVGDFSEDETHTIASASSVSLADRTELDTKIVHLKSEARASLEADDKDMKQKKLADQGYSVKVKVAKQIGTADSNTLVKEEISKTGSVSKHDIISNYLQTMGSHHIPMTILICTVTYGLLAFNDIRLAIWLSDSANEELSKSEHLRRAGLYVGVAILHIFGIETISILNAYATVRASKAIHSKCIDKLMHAPITWYESTPSGRILSRFSGDLAIVDRQLNFVFDDVFHFAFILLAIGTVIAYVLPILIPLMVISLIIFLIQIVMVDRTNREVKRFSNQSLGPILTNVSETVNARLIIQVMKLENYFHQRQNSKVNRYVKYQFLSSSLVNFGTLSTSFISFFVSSGAAFISVSRRDEFAEDSSMIGLALSYSFLLPYFLGILSIVLPMLFTSLTSLERMLEYTSDAIPQEPAWNLEADSKLVTTNKKVWLSRGSIKFSDVTFVYRAGLKPALSNISFTISQGEKVGVVGRTGAGKSSLLLLLFRVYDPSTGGITIDGVNLKDVGLQTLRSTLTIIPQEPLLLGGNVRDNLDPFKLHDDSKLQKALRKVDLNVDLLADDVNISSLSIGELQLIGLARTLLKESMSVVIMDEPSASLDVVSDRKMQAVVRKEFKHCTLITIAHRLATIIDNDKILVMDKGKVAEYDKPKELVTKPNGVFRSMLDSMGESAAQKLIAKVMT